MGPKGFRAQGIVEHGRCSKTWAQKGLGLREGWNIGRCSKTWAQRGLGFRE